MTTKSIIFFDGDGTLWYPKKTKGTVAPHWIYGDTTIGERYLEHMTLTPAALATLKKLKKSGVELIVLSTHPHSKKEADVILSRKIEHFRLTEIFHRVYSSRNHPEGKGQKIAEILKKRKLPKNKALMVGDNYRWDYRSAKKVGVDALLIKNDYMQKPRSKGAIINGLEDIPRRYKLESLKT